MYLKDLLGSIVRIGYCIPIQDFYLVLHGLIRINQLCLCVQVCQIVSKIINCFFYLYIYTDILFTRHIYNRPFNMRRLLVSDFLVTSWHLGLSEVGIIDRAICVSVVCGLTSSATYTSRFVLALRMLIQIHVSGQQSFQIWQWFRFTGDYCRRQAMNYNERPRIH